MNELEKIRQGLVNYIGAAQAAVTGNEKEKRHLIVSILAEEALKLTQEENDTNDFFVALPMLRALIVILVQKKNELANLAAGITTADAQIENYKKSIDFLKSLDKGN
jgi:hypothetical protein